MSKSITQSGVDISRLIPLKRQLDVDGIEEFYEQIVGQETKDDNYVWEKDFPTYILGIINQVKNMFKFDNEVKSYKVTLYPPAFNKSKDVHTIQKTPLNILTRVIVCAGHRESFEISINAGGHNATCNYLCAAGDAFQIVSGSAPAATLTFDDTVIGKLPPRKGFRNNTIKKDPTKRYVIVVDPIIDENVIADALKKSM